jgi:hypothetical protein
LGAASSFEHTSVARGLRGDAVANVCGCTQMIAGIGNGCLITAGARDVLAAG